MMCWQSINFFSDGAKCASEIKQTLEEISWFIFLFLKIQYVLQSMLAVFRNLKLFSSNIELNVFRENFYGFQKSRDSVIDFFYSCSTLHVCWKSPKPIKKHILQKPTLFSWTGSQNNPINHSITWFIQWTFRFISQHS